MGVDWGDYLHEGRFSLAVTNFTEQGTALYHNLGTDSFADVSVRSKVMKPTYPLVSWGTAFVDMTRRLARFIHRTAAMSIRRSITCPAARDIANHWCCSVIIAMPHLRMCLQFSRATHEIEAGCGIRRHQQ